MNYIVMEIQTSNGTTAILTNVYTDRNQAEQQYHAVLSAAAVSNVEFHACTLTASNGQHMRDECYVHGIPVNEEE